MLSNCYDRKIVNFTKNNELSQLNILKAYDILIEETKK
jgi:hypothetical protein